MGVGPNDATGGGGGGIPLVAVTGDLNEWSGADGVGGADEGPLELEANCLAGGFFA